MYASVQEDPVNDHAVFAGRKKKVSSNAKLLKMDLNGKRLRTFRRLLPSNVCIETSTVKMLTKMTQKEMLKDEQISSFIFYLKIIVEYVLNK